MPESVLPAVRRFGSRAAMRTLLAGLVVGALASTGAAVSVAADLPEQEPGVTLRTYLTPPLQELCTLKSGQTPNVDKLMSTIDFSSDADFGIADNFISHAIANLTLTTPGEYAFRLTSDDGSRFTLDDTLLIDNDGLHGDESVEGSRTLDVGVHTIFVEHFDAGNGQSVKLEWRPPGASSFTVIPNSALSTDSGVVRVTAPGTKYCEGSDDTAGDGLRLDAVNPNYDLVDIRPEGFEPKVSGLDFTDDGKLAVITTGSVSSGGWVPNPKPGEVFFLEGAQEADGPEDVVATKVATGLKNPMGIDIIGDKVYVSERHQLTELSDSDGDGFYDAHTKIAEWPDGGNFHEFAFGLIHDDENFYLNLSVAIDNGGATTNPQPGTNRGTTLKVNRQSGEVTYVAGGLRTPNGIGFGPNDDLFAMDNQGAWLPSSKLVHVKQDRFFNHFTTPSGPFDHQPVSQPAVWIPQNEIGNSPSAPILVEEGMFAGQMLFGDVTYGGLQRAYLEQVDGEYQGAVFRHTAGIEVGVNRVITGPDGSLYVGGTGEGGNWGEAGKLPYGLQKLVPVGDDTFDIKSMSVVEGGFELEYTQPVSQETVDNIAEAYQAQQWRYIPTQTYGGPKVGEESLAVTSAEVSADRRTVTVQLEGLKPGRVVHIRSPRPFAAESGDELWSTEAWYTLNSLPGYETLPDRGWYEAEESTLVGSASVDTDHSNYSGSGFVGGMWNQGVGVSFAVDVETAGNYPVNLRYANGPDPRPGAKNVSLYVNGEKIDPWSLPSTGDWKTWQTTTRNLDLAAGSNSIMLKYDAGDDGNVNIDVLSVGESVDICTAADVEEGYRALFDGTLASLDDWRLAGPGSFGRQEDCSIRSQGGLGLLWNRTEELSQYSLKLDWKLVADHNGGVFVGFPDPGNDPWVAVNEGYEIQIDASDAPDRTTGSVYTFQAADNDAVAEALNPVGEWNGYEIVVTGQNIKIYLNGTLVNDFTSTEPARDLQGFIGLQNHGNGEVVSYRNVRVKDLNEPDPLSVTATADVRCMAGKAFLTVRATNTDTVPADVTLTTAYGERVFSAVQPGKAVFHSFTTRLKDLSEGTAEVSAAGDGRTGEAQAAYAAESCG